MNTDISNYKGVFDEIFQGKDYELFDIHGGVSYDIKVKASCEGKNYIVKVIEGNALNPAKPVKRLLWYQALTKIRQNNKSLLCPFWFKIRNDHVVTVTEWIYGKQLHTVFKTSPELMAPLGKKAGKVVKDIHQQEFVKEAIKANGFKIEPSVRALVNKLVDEIRLNGISFAGMNKAIYYLNNNLSLVSEERASIVHNDLRPENFIFTDENLYLFDFDSGTISDCYADFTYLTVMSEKKYRPFSYGFIMSYFDNEIPEEFWKVNLIYSILKLLDYAIYKYNKKGTMVVQQAAGFIETFDDYNTVVPTWWKTLEAGYREEYFNLLD